MSYRRPPHSSADAGLPLGSMPDEIAGQDSQFVGLFVAGPIGALVGRVLAASIKNAGAGTISALDFDVSAPKPKLPTAPSGSTKKPASKPVAGAAHADHPASEKSLGRKRRKRRRP